MHLLYSSWLDPSEFGVEGVYNAVRETRRALLLEYSTIPLSYLCHYEFLNIIHSFIHRPKMHLNEHCSGYLRLQMQENAMHKNSSV
jgi:hypothetical protein